MLICNEIIDENVAHRTQKTEIKQNKLALDKSSLIARIELNARKVTKLPEANVVIKVLAAATSLEKAS